MLLTDAERQRFAEWLRQDALSSRLLVEAISAGASGRGTGDPILAKWLRLEADAQDLIAAKLERIAVTVMKGR